jgi:hypothetical protein
MTRSKWDDFHTQDDLRITSYALKYYVNSPGINCPESYVVDPTSRIQKSGSGFGIAYPNQAPDGKHWDVGIYSFLEHINAQIPTILSAYRQL